MRKLFILEEKIYHMHHSETFSAEEINVLLKVEALLKKLYEHDVPKLKKSLTRISNKKFRYGKKSKVKKEKEYKSVASSNADYLSLLKGKVYECQEKSSEKQPYVSFSSEIKLFDIPLDSAFEKIKETFYEIANKIDENLGNAKVLENVFNQNDFDVYKKANIVKIEYENPIFINNQWTYQRIFIKNEKDGLSVYELTMAKAKEGVLETKTRYDEKFDTYYFYLLNGVRDGENKAYWEVWVNGKIVEDALDKTKLKKGDVIEWRLANEREQACGGGYVQDISLQNNLGMLVYEKFYQPLFFKPYFQPLFRDVHYR